MSLSLSLFVKLNFRKTRPPLFNTLFSVVCAHFELNKQKIVRIFLILLKVLKLQINNRPLILRLTNTGDKNVKTFSTFAIRFYNLQFPLKK